MATRSLTDTELAGPDGRTFETQVSDCWQCGGHQVWAAYGSYPLGGGGLRPSSDETGRRRRPGSDCCVSEKLADPRAGRSLRRALASRIANGTGAQNGRRGTAGRGHFPELLRTLSSAGRQWRRAEVSTARRQSCGTRGADYVARATDRGRRPVRTPRTGRRHAKCPHSLANSAMPRWPRCSRSFAIRGATRPRQ